MKKKVSISILIILLLIIGLINDDSLFKRAAPDKADYIRQFLPEIGNDQIKKLDWTYKGAVGGFILGARVEFYDSLSTAPFWHLPEAQILTFKGSFCEVEKEFIDSMLSIAFKGKDELFPEWLDVSYEKPIYIHNDILNGECGRGFLLIKDSRIMYCIISGE